MVKLGLNAQCAHGVHTVLHGTPVCDAVIFTNTGKRGWIIFCIVAVPSVLHNNRSRLGKSLSSKCCRPVRAKPGSHPRACGTAPERVTVSIYF